MNLKLIKMSEEYRTQLYEMMDEWCAAEKDITPAAINRVDYRDFANYLKSLESPVANSQYVPATTLFCLDIDRNILVGAVDIRHYLNDRLLFNGGHIGDGVRPSERRKGIATEMIKLALAKCSELGIDRVLMVCDKSNIGSAKSIVKNGGVLENEIGDGESIVQRYWISL